MGEPLLTDREITRALEERLRGQRGLQRRLREAERGSLETRFKGPGEVGTRCVRKPHVRHAQGNDDVDDIVHNQSFCAKTGSVPDWVNFYIMLSSA